MTTTPLGVGVVGAGPVTQSIHLPTLARLPDDFTVVSILDVDAGAATAVATQVGARVAGSLAELLADDAVDVVVICTPPQLHAEQVAAACRAGVRAVLCEKPLAVSADEADAIAAVSTDTGVPVIVGAMHAFDPAWLAAAESWGDLPASVHTIRSSIVLPPNSRYEDVATELLPRPSRPGPRISDPAVAEAVLRGLVLGLTIHDLPLVRRLLPPGELEVLSAVLPTPDSYLIHARVGDCRLELHAAVTRTWQPAWVLEAYGPDSGLQLDFPPSFVEAGSATSTLLAPNVRQVHGPWPSSGYLEEWRAVAEIARGTRPGPDPAETVADLRLGLTIADQAVELQRSAPQAVPA